MNIPEIDRDICAFCSEMRKIANDPSSDEKKKKKLIKRKKRSYRLKSKNTICYKNFHFEDTLTAEDVYGLPERTVLVSAERGFHGTKIEIPLKNRGEEYAPGDKITVSGILKAELSPYAFSDIYASHALYAAELVKIKGIIKQNS